MKKLGWLGLGLGLGLLGLLCGGCGAAVSTDKLDDGINKVAAPGEAPDLVDVGVTLAQGHARADAASTVIARVRIDGAKIERAVRPPVNVSLVIDTSASMEGDAIAQARKASLTMLDTLSNGDRLSIVTFDSTARVLVASTVLGKASRKAIAADIESITAQGSTDMAAGLSTGLGQVQQQLREDGVNRIVLIGDGVPNDPAPLGALAAQAAQQHIPITTLGLGLEYDETIMGNLAQTSGGSFHFVEDPAEVAEVLKEEVLKLDQLVAQNLVVDIQPGPGVSVLEVVGLPTTPLGRGVRVQVGELHEHESRDIIVKLNAPARKDGYIIELADVLVSYADVTMSAGTLNDATFFSVPASANPEDLAQPADRDVVISVARAEVAGLVLQAIAAARAGNLPQAEALLDQAEKYARLKAKELDDDKLLKKADGMADVRKSLPSLVNQPAVMIQPQVPGAPPSAVPTKAPAILRSAHAEAMSDLN